MVTNYWHETDILRLQAENFSDQQTIEHSSASNCFQKNLNFNWNSEMDFIKSKNLYCPS